LPIQAYTATLSPIASIICGTFHYVTVEKGKTYVGERFKNADGEPLKDRLGTNIKAVLKYTWYITTGASAGECAGLIAYGINNYCVSEVNGKSICNV
jgi:cytosine/uracil/thiamine/allantoin permease